VGHSALQDRARGCLHGAAIGDALGGSTEGGTPASIRERFGGWVEDIEGPYFERWWERPLAPYHKGEGHITDDTLLTLALCTVYLRRRGHLDAHAIAEDLIPEIVTPIWVPELDAEVPLVQRLAYAEKWLLLRLHYGNVDPREAGVGNMVNCGAAMYMAPVGIVNAGNPEGAYAEALDIAGAHQSSYGREAAGVHAAAVAAALAPGAGVDSVVEVALALAKDGTREAIAAVVAEARRFTDWREALAPLRAAMAPFDTVGEEYRHGDLAARRPSRVHAIEEVPLALGMLVVGRGEYTPTVLGSVNYGRDADSIASMAGALAGALGGADAVPERWRKAVAEASRRNFDEVALSMAALAEELHDADVARRRAHEAAFAALREPR
jgi:ADP-ribosylglycohydrolase